MCKTSFQPLDRSEMLSGPVRPRARRALRNVSAGCLMLIAVLGAMSSPTVSRAIRRHRAERSCLAYAAPTRNVTYEAREAPAGTSDTLAGATARPTLATVAAAKLPPCWVDFLSGVESRPGEIEGSPGSPCCSSTACAVKAGPNAWCRSKPGNWTATLST
jgi:hypothetical protein